MIERKNNIIYRIGDKNNFDIWTSSINMIGTVQ